MKEEVTKENWLLPPYNRWGFQHVKDYAPTAVIENGEDKAPPFEREEKDLLELSFALHDGSETTVRKVLEETHTDGFLVLQKGKILTEQYYNNMTPESMHLVMSCSKSITAAVAGILVEEGKFSPEEDATHYVPELINSAFGNATVQDLLDMTVSMDKKANKQFSSYTTAPDWNVYQYIQKISLNGEHGKVFAYSSPSSMALAWVLERASDHYLPDLISDKLWSKIGAHREIYTIVDSNGTAIPSGGFSMTLHDLARFAQMMLQRGFFNGKQLVPEKWVNDTLQNGDKQAFKSSDYGAFLPNGSYRNMWWITQEGAFLAIGAYGQMVYVDPASESIIIKLSSQPEETEVGPLLLTQAMITEVAKELS